jgi:hypothetical protein
LHLDLDEEDVSMKVTLPLRHILTFPFLALHGVVREALKLGIEKAEMRQAVKMEEISKRVVETKWAAKALSKEDLEMEEAEQQDTPDQDNSLMQPPHAERKLQYRIPKRPLRADTNKSCKMEL